jgi:hypothetical protein
MNKIIIILVLLLALPVVLSAQYTGGIGGGAFSVEIIDSPLPVELASFTSIVSGQNIKLNWVTASEQNNSGFDIERKSIAGNFAKVGFLQGHGTVTIPTNYSFEDKNLQTGKYQYRLKQIDNNGNFEFHNLNGTVEIGIPAKFSLSQNYPNPFNPVTKIDFDIPKDANVKITVFDMSGREIRTLVKEFKTAGYYTVQFDASGISSGVYFYRLMTDGDIKSVITKKLVLVK